MHVERMTDAPARNGSRSPCQMGHLKVALRRRLRRARHTFELGGEEREQDRTHPQHHTDTVPRSTDAPRSTQFRRAWSPPPAQNFETAPRAAAPHETEVRRRPR